MADVFTQYTEEDAENAALNHYADNSRLEVSSADTRMIVYSLNEYEDEPVHLKAEIFTLTKTL